MKILYIISGLELGGAEKQVVDMCEQLALMGHDIQILSMMGDVELRPKNNDIKIHALDMRKNLVSLLRSLFVSVNIIRRFSPDVLHGHLFHGNIYSRILKLFFPSKPLINTEHSKYIGGGTRHKIYKFTNFNVNVFTNVSSEALKNFTNMKTFPFDKSVCVYNGINSERYVFSESDRKQVRAKYDVADDEYLFLAVGRLVKAKDFSNLLDAFEEVSKSIRCKLIIIGEGEEKDFLLKEIERLNLTGKALLLGAKSNVEKYLSAADTFVLSSAWEGFGLVVAEAMCCKRIVVATDAGGVREVIGHPEFIVPIRDSKQLALKMRDSVLIDEIDRKKITELGYQRIISTFDITKVCQVWEDMYANLTVDKSK
ncbi:glycosyltransferase [Citrobacter freundii]|uniref:glycosyltransferase n=1 Tax=Citrobacter freundii TaxID=546 RepID=UPI001F335487|nr:glycosyltransferase [Citrobacter freundii]MCE9874337.1 glycosyltransferase [Citrobacter freundii]